MKGLFTMADDIVEEVSGRVKPQAKLTWLKPDIFRVSLRFRVWGFRGSCKVSGVSLGPNRWVRMELEERWQQWTASSRSFQVISCPSPEAWGTLRLKSTSSRPNGPKVVHHFDGFGKSTSTTQRIHLPLRPVCCFTEKYRTAIKQPVWCGSFVFPVQDWFSNGTIQHSSIQSGQNITTDPSVALAVWRCSFWNRGTPQSSSISNDGMFHGRPTGYWDSPMTMVPGQSRAAQAAHQCHKGKRSQPESEIPIQPQPRVCSKSKCLMMMVII